MMSLPLAEFRVKSPGVQKWFRLSFRLGRILKSFGYRANFLSKFCQKILGFFFTKTQPSPSQPY